MLPNVLLLVDVCATPLLLYFTNPFTISPVVGYNDAIVSELAFEPSLANTKAELPIFVTLNGL